MAGRKEESNDRSEKWQEGEIGTAYSEWADSLENFEMDEINVEFPDPLGIDAIPDFDDIDWLPPPTSRENK